MSGADFGGDGGAGKNEGGISPEQRSILDDLAGIFSTSASSVYGMLAGKEVTALVRETAVLSQRDFIARPEGAAFAFRVTCGGLNDAPLVLVITERGALTLADLMMGGEGKDLPEEAGELYLNAAQEGLSQVVGAAFTSVSGMLGGKRLIPENISSALEPDDWLPFPARSPEEAAWTISAAVSIEGLGDFPSGCFFPLARLRHWPTRSGSSLPGRRKKKLRQPPRFLRQDRSPLRLLPRELPGWIHRRRKRIIPPSETSMTSPPWMSVLPSSFPWSRSPGQDTAAAGSTSWRIFPSGDRGIGQDEKKYLRYLEHDTGFRDRIRQNGR